MDKETQDVHSSLADSKTMLITRFAWVEKVEQIKQAHEEIAKLNSWLKNAEAKERHYDELRRLFNEMEARAIQAEQERDNLLKGLQLIDDYVGTKQMDDSRLWNIYTKTRDLLTQYDTAQPATRNCGCKITGPILCPECQGEDKTNE